MKKRKHVISIVLAIILLAAIIVFFTLPNNEVQEEITEDTENQEEQVEEIPVEETPTENETIPEGPQTYTVRMIDFEFVPDEINVTIGDTVTWVNEGKGKHYVLSTTGRKLNSGYIEPGESWSFTFEEEGKYNYFSPVYKAMGGVVIVE